MRRRSSIGLGQSQVSIFDGNITVLAPTVFLEDKDLAKRFDIQQENIFHASIGYVFEPDYYIRITIETTQSNFIFDYHDAPLEVKIPGYRRTNMKFRLATGIPEEEYRYIYWYAVDQLVPEHISPVARLDFCIVNGIHHRSSKLPASACESKGFKLQIEDIYDNAKINSPIGYEITHQCRLTKTDGALFLPLEPQITSFVQNVEAAFSFIRSKKCGVVNFSGLDNGNNASYSFHLPVEVDRLEENFTFRDTPNWLVNADKNSDIEFIESFLNANDSAPLHQAIYWLRKVNLAHSYEEKIVLLQIPLESLAYWYLVDYRKAISLDGFNNLRASDWLRLFLTMLSVPTGLPALIKESLNNDYIDGPHVFTVIRNSLVHPSERNQRRLKAFSASMLSTIMRMATSHLELVILHLSGYQGLYTPLFEYDHEVPVPWQGKI